MCATMSVEGLKKEIELISNIHISIYVHMYINNIYVCYEYIYIYLYVIIKWYGGEGRDFEKRNRIDIYELDMYVNMICV
jgi:hypothetical protein